MSKYIISNNNVRIIPDAAVNIVEKLPLATYTVEAMPVTGELYLKRTSNFDKPSRVYGEADMQSDRIINTFKQRERNTGVMLNGEKGSGKTFLAKYISWKLIEDQYSTILINDQYDTVSLSLLIQNISEPCLIIFDEFEKIYTKENEEDMKDPQTGLLTLLDGLLITKKLFVFTCNECERVTEMMKNRPGRIFYSIDFGGLSDAVIDSYCKENLKHSSHLSEIINIKKLFKHFTFDMLQALVEEVNRYNESPLEAVKMMNIIPESKQEPYAIKIVDIASKVTYENNYDGVNDVLYACPFEEKVGSVRVWRKDKNGENSDKAFYINIRGKDLQSQNDNQFIYTVEGKYKVILTREDLASSRNLWRFAIP